MSNATKLKLGFSLLAVCGALAPVAPASAEITLHRDPAAAVPFVADVSGSGAHPVLRRDGTAAVPFVAQVGPGQVSAGDSFDWGDAALGALAGGALVLLGALAARALRGRAPRQRAAGVAGGAERLN